MFMRLDDLTDKLVGKSARGKRPFVRWPEELVDYTKAVSQSNAEDMVISGVLILLAIPLAVILGTLPPGLEILHNFLRLMLLLIAAGGGLGIIIAFIGYEMENADDVEDEQSRKTGEIMKPLLGKDPYLDLRLAAFLTVGAMPEWLREQMRHESVYEKGPGWRKAHLVEELCSGEYFTPAEDFKRLLSKMKLRDDKGPEWASAWKKIRVVAELYSRRRAGMDCEDLLSKIEVREEYPDWVREWQKTRFSEEPYTVERAGLDYLILMNRIARLDECPSTFFGESFPSVDYRLPSSLKDSVVEIVLFLSSLPDSGEEPDEKTMEAVMDSIDSLATIDGESFTTAARRLHGEEEDKARAEKKAAEDKARADYNDGIMELVDTTRSMLAVRNDEGYRAILRGMDRLSKINETGGRGTESADVSPACKADG